MRPRKRTNCTCNGRSHAGSCLRCVPCRFRVCVAARACHRSRGSEHFPTAFCTTLSFEDRQRLTCASRALSAQGACGAQRALIERGLVVPTPADVSACVSAHVEARTFEHQRCVAAAAAFAGAGCVGQPVVVGARYVACTYVIVADRRAGSSDSCQQR
jgi:hypothetical protein